MISYLQVEGLKKSFGDLELFDDLSLNINEGQRVGLIARNGTGKTTLLNIIADKEDYQVGKITFRRDLKIGYLEQDPRFAENLMVWEACFVGNSPVLRTIASYEKALEENEPEQLHHAIAEMDAQQAWNYESQIRQILTQLNIKNLNQPVGQLSGGQIKRIALANVLISEPDLLILDEPTNHLDLEMTQWLENYLVNTRQSVLMVTHDRYFLDRVCTEILEIDDRRIYAYSGNYTLYLEKRQQRYDTADARRDRDKNLYSKELDWIRRQPQARGTKARSRVESFYELEERLKKRKEEGNVRLDVKASYIGKKIFELYKVSKRFGDRVILDGFDYRFARYEKMGIIGDNGTGKSTFIKLLMGLIPSDSGTIDVGETVSFGYYSQQGIAFDEGAKVIDIVTDIAEYVDLNDGRRLSASQLLQYFLFTPQTQHNFVARLSGGERRRLYLCTILMRNPNFLILDEPTNDLDIMTLQVLEEYLQEYNGCLIVISHDRYFMDKTVDHLLVFEGQGKIKDFPGSYSDYLDWKALKASDVQPTTSQNIRKTIEKNSEKPSRNTKIKRSYQQNRELEHLECEIPQLEQEKKELEDRLGSGTLSVDQLTELSMRIAQVIDLIDEKSMRWLELSEIE